MVYLALKLQHTGEFVMFIQSELI